MSFILQPNVSHFFQDTRNDVCCFLQIHLVHTLVNQHLPKFVITDTHFIPPSGDLSSFESPSRSFSLIITLSTFLSRVWVQRRSAEDWQTSCRPSNIRQAPHQRAAHSQGSSLLPCFSSCPCLAFSKHPLFFHGIRENSLPIIDHAHGFCKSVHAPVSRFLGRKSSMHSPCHSQRIASQTTKSTIRQNNYPKSSNQQE